MTIQKPKVPKLRFPQFREEWKKQKISDIGHFYYGKSAPKFSIFPDAATPCVRYGELYSSYKEVIAEIKSHTNIDPKNLKFSKGGEILVPRVGEDPLDFANCSLLKVTGVAIGEMISVFNTNEDALFQTYYFNTLKKQFARVVEGGNVSNLYFRYLEPINIQTPSREEQQKIAKFLSSVNTKIEQLEKKKALSEQYKKGMMQKLFSQELRFKDELGNEYPAWEEKRIGDICEVRRGASPRPISSPKWFDESSEIGWVRISDVTKSTKYLRETTQYLSGDGVKKSRLILKGNMIMSICATIGKPIYTTFDVCIHDGFVVFDGLSAEKEFLFYLLELMQKRWYRYGQPGTQINLNSGIVSNENISLPSNPEQIKIANFLSAIDKKIELVGTELEKAQAFKKGLLQQMFI